MINVIIPDTRKTYTVKTVEDIVHTWQTPNSSVIAHRQEKTSTAADSTQYYTALIYSAYASTRI